MAQRIVDLLELIEIQVQQAQHTSTPCVRELGLECRAEQHTIGQIGQRIMVGHVRNLRIGNASLGDIFIGGEPPLLNGLVGHRERATIRAFPDQCRGRIPADELFAAAEDLSQVVGSDIAHRDRELRQFRMAHVRGDGTCRQTCQLTEAAIDQEHFACTIDHDQALQHIVQHGPEPVQNAFAELPFPRQRPCGNEIKEKAACRQAFGPRVDHGDASSRDMSAHR
jgi:hypothetical protein